MNNRRGSATVFLVFVLAAMVGTAAVFIYIAKQTAYTGIGEGAVILGMRSVLSEFDLELKDRYDLMAFDKSGMETALEIGDYADYAFTEDSPVNDLEVIYGDYALSNVSTLKAQILDYMELAAAEGMIGDKNADRERTVFRDRTLRNKAVIRNLPSMPFAESGYNFLEKLEKWKDKLDSAGEIFDKTKDTYFIDLYIIDHFKHAAGGPVDEKTFFDNEVEYVISGNYSNEKNRKAVETGLKVLRTALNASYIYTDKQKNAETMAAAELLTPGAAPATQAVLVATWAAAEADNDVKLLLKGNPVPLVKSKASWATDLDKVMENITEDCIDTGNKKGLYYSDYMMIFLHFTDEKLKLARTADLIQINMKGTYNRDFLMSTANTGFYLNGKICGKEIEYETYY